MGKHGSDIDIEYTNFISYADYEYIYNYFENEPDCTPKKDVDLEIKRQTEEICNILGDNEEENYLLLEKSMTKTIV